MEFVDAFITAVLKHVAALTWLPLPRDAQPSKQVKDTEKALWVALAVVANCASVTLGS